MGGYIHRLSAGDECRQVGGLPVAIICLLKGAGFLGEDGCSAIGHIFTCMSVLRGKIIRNQ